MNATPAVYSSGVLRFYASGTSTPQNVYSGSDLTGASTTITLNSAGRPSQDIFLSDALYKVTLEDSLGNIIWTVDPYYTSDYSTYGQFYTYAGSPNGNVAGTAGSGTIPADGLWDRTNSILYVCTTSGVAAAAVWTAVNASSATPAVPQPQGYLTLTSATPVIAADVASATAVYYTPFAGNLVPIYNGSSMIPTTFAELTLTLASQHVLNSIYDVFVFSNSGVVTIATGPAWNTITAGSGARGTGASTTELQRVNGYWTNKVLIAARNGASTYNISANLGTYVGSIYIDGTAGQVTCHRAWGQSRKWGVWNAYNRQMLHLKAGDSTASWVYNTATIRASNGSSANSMTVFAGLPEEGYDTLFTQVVNPAAVATSSRCDILIGYNSTTAGSGKTGTVEIQENTAAAASRNDVVARFWAAPSIGINTISCLENVLASGASNQVFYGTEANMIMSTKWCG